MIKKYIQTIALFVAVLSVTSCDKFLDIEPKGRTIPETTDDFRMLINSAYNSFPEYKSVIAMRSDELRADEFSDDFPTYKDIFIWNDATSDRQTRDYPYIAFYQTIFYANETINNGSQKMPNSADKNQILAEAHCLRAYSYFGLVNMYAKPYQQVTASSESGVPLTFHINLEQQFHKATLQGVYDQILTDITAAESLMQIDNQEVNNRYRFSKASLYGFASRVYLYMNNFEKSIEMANKALAIENTLIDLNTDLVVPSLYNSKETLLAFENPAENTLRLASYVATDFKAMYDVTNDLRLGIYISGNRIAKGGDDKYKCSLRTSELYLNKAESEARLGNDTAAKTTLLTLLKNRYTSGGYTTVEATINGLLGNDLISEILNERARELAFEGHRWFDLRRANQKQIEHSYNGTTYTLQTDDPRYVIPFPADARSNNPNL